MSDRRTLVVVPPFTGHINPTLGVGAKLLERGQRVAWCGYKLPKLPVGAEAFTLKTGAAGADPTADTSQGAELRGLRSVKFFYEEVLVPLAHAMLPQVEEVVRIWRPDVLLVDQQALAGAFAARRANLPWISSCSTSASVVEPLAEFPRIIEWRDGLLATLQQELGLPVQVRPGLSELGILVFSSRELVRGQLPNRRVHFVGPVTTARAKVDFPWDQLEHRDRVLISLGTISGERGGEFYRAVAEAFDGLDAQAILVAPEDKVPTLPPNVLRFDFVPQVRLLARMNAVVSHGGHNTVVESLAAGVPMVLAPIRDDQPLVASQVVEAGAGIRLKFGRLNGERLRIAIQEVLSNPAYTKAARRIGESFDPKGVSRAANVITKAKLPPVI